MKFVVVSCSLDPSSSSAIMAHRVHQTLLSQGESALWVDMRQNPKLPIFEPGASVPESIMQVKDAIKRAKGIVLACPVYNYGVSAGAKNLIEWLGDSFMHKTVGFLSALGSKRSYMSFLPLANSLMLEFETIIVPYFVCAEPRDFRAGGLENPEILKRLENFVTHLITLTPYESNF